jgi:hypothetical protein
MPVRIEYGIETQKSQIRPGFGPLSWPRKIGGRLECGCRHERIVSEIVQVNSHQSFVPAHWSTFLKLNLVWAYTYSYFPPAPNPRPPSLLVSPLPNWAVSVVRTLHKVFVSLLSLSDTGMTLLYSSPCLLCFPLHSVMAGWQ